MLETASKVFCLNSLTPYPPPLDTEWVRLQEVVGRALLSLHQATTEEATVYCWGREYRITVSADVLTVVKVRKFAAEAKSGKQPA